MSIASPLLSFTLADIAIIIIIAISVLISLVRGFLKELMSLIIWAIGFWAAIRWHNTLAVVLEGYLVNPTIRQIVSFVGLFLLVLILGTLFSYLFSFIIIKSGLSGTDRLLGMVFGGARGVLLVAVMLLLISATAFVQDTWWKQSVLIPHFQVVVEWLRIFLPQKMTSIASILH